MISYSSDAVYDVTRRDTFTNLSDIWAKEIDLYSTSQDCIKMLVGNKVDKVCTLGHSFTDHFTSFCLTEKKNDGGGWLVLIQYNCL